MVFPTLSTLISLAALSSALPTSETPAAPREFTLSMLGGKGLLPIQATLSGTIGNLDLTVPADASAPPSRAYFNNTMLEYLVPSPGLPSSIPYGVHLISPGDNTGYTTPVTAIFDNEGATQGFSFNRENALVPPRTAALQGFYACGLETETRHLVFGVQNEDGSAPEGCVGASIYGSYV